MAGGILTAIHGRAQFVEQAIKSFGFDQSGAQPTAPPLIGSDGALYCATSSGGSNGFGAIFRLPANGSNCAVLHEFGTVGSDGRTPLGSLAQGRDGWLYGTTCFGGSNGAGTVFKLNIDGTGYAVLRSFSANGIDGQNPHAALVQGRDGALYATTAAGGSCGAGAVFALQTSGAGFVLLHSFLTNGIDGQAPLGPLAQAADGSLWGTTSAGGSNSAGTIFRLEPCSGGYALVRAFVANGTDGLDPAGPLVQDAKGVWYGVTSAGGTSNAGTVFKLNSDGTGYALLYTFLGYPVDGEEPDGLILGSDGALYGTTAQGGGNGGGTVFRLNTDGRGYVVLVPGFGDYYPQGLVQGANGLLYGTTFSGGGFDWRAGGDGAVFEMTTNSSAYEVLFSVGSGGPADGSSPSTALLSGSDGALYGTTGSGGNFGTGIFFKLNIDGAGYQILHNFGSVQNDGAYPGARLVEDANGMLYGTTVGGGSNGAGTVFKVSADGSGYAVLHQFQSSGADGQAPWSALALATNGTLFGTTVSGGNFGYGCVFKIGTDGAGYQRLYDFPTNGPNGPQSPVGDILQGSDGALYGTSSAGGSYGYGTIFKLNTDGTGYQVIYNLMDPPSNGWGISAWLIFGSDGWLYGVARTGGANHAGSVFKLQPNGAGYTLLYSFNPGSLDGEYPDAGLMQASDGTFYGTTYFGGNNYIGGTVYALAANGACYSVFCNCDFANSGIVNPIAPVTQGADGGIYGTGFYGGAGELGGVFRLRVFQPSLAIRNPLTNSAAELSLNAIAGSSYRVDASTNLLQWVTLTNIMDTAGTVQFLDPSASRYPRRFYRAVWSP